MSTSPEDVQQIAWKAAADHFDPGTTDHSVLMETIEEVIMADRVARPAVQPEPLAREEMIHHCKSYAPDVMAGGSDCANCGWPQERHAADRQRSRATTGEA